MSLELVSTIAAVGTFLVIAATAVAALVQLRHMRISNQINALTEYRQTILSPEFFAARRFLQERLPELAKEPSFLQRLAKPVLDDELQRPINLVGNFFENIGAFVKYGIVDRRIACDLWSGVVVQTWKALLPVTLVRRNHLSAALWENFEYLAVISQDFMEQHPHGTYPPGTRRFPMDSP